MGKKNSVKAIACEMCGSNDVVKQNGMYVCQYCGTKYSVEEARKLMVEGTVKIDGPVEVKGTMTLEKMAQNGETFINLGKMDDALRVFTEMTEKYPEDYRGWWGKARVYSNNLRSLTTDKCLVGDNEIYGYTVAIEKDYVTDNKFYDARRTALAVAPKGEKHDEVMKKGKAYLNLHRKNNCKKIIKKLLDDQNCNSLVGLQTENNNLYRKIVFAWVVFTILIVIGVILAILAVTNLIEVFNTSNWNGIWRILLFGFLAFIAFMLVMGSYGEALSAKRDYNRLVDIAKQIEFHENNLKRM